MVFDTSYIEKDTSTVCVSQHSPLAISLRARNNEIVNDKRNPEAWSHWLLARLTERGWRQADLVANSEGLIKRDRASKWARGVEAPSHRLAVVTANTLGVPRAEALKAAGFAPLSGDPITQGTPALSVQAALARASDIELAEEVLRRARLAADSAKQTPAAPISLTDRVASVSGLTEDVPHIPENVEEVWGHAAHPDTEEPIDHES